MGRNRPAGVALALLLVAGAGCGDDTSGPAATIDTALVGSWESVAHATSAGGLPICEFVGLELDLAGSGTYRFRTYDPVTARSSPCPDTTLRSETVGRWSVETAGMITFAPSLAGGDDPVTLAYELRDDELVMAGVVVYTRPSGP